MKNDLFSAETGGSMLSGNIWQIRNNHEADNSSKKIPSNFRRWETIQKSGNRGGELYYGNTV